MNKPYTIDLKGHTIISVDKGDVRQAMLQGEADGYIYYAMLVRAKVPPKPTREYQKGVDMWKRKFKVKEK